MSHRNYPVSGAGLGLRRALLGPLQDHAMESVNFMEVAPENWINVGGKLGRSFQHFTGRFPFLCHGLSLSIGGPAPLDETNAGRSIVDRVVSATAAPQSGAWPPASWSKVTSSGARTRRTPSGNSGGRPGRGGASSSARNTLRALPESAGMKDMVTRAPSR